ncbi:MAG TPA: hypothetical protein VF883_18860 [Thermoanaerobaculia bacterium]|jgi:hypothetical protein
MDLEKALEARDRIAAFLGVDPVSRRTRRAPRVSIGIGPSETNGLKLTVRAPSEKELERALGAGILDEVRTMAGLFEVDVRITGEISVAPPQPMRGTSTLAIGASVGHYNCTAGSVGFFAQSLSESTVGFVSNNHVIADCDYGKDGDDVLHPGPFDHGDRSRDVVAELVSGYPRLQKNGAVVDAAFARLRDGIEYDASSIGASLKLKPLLVPLFKQREVLKLGRSTQLTRGRISAFALQNVDVEYPKLQTRIAFDRQIEIVPAVEGERFCEPGDSGSLVVNPNGHPIGLLFAANRDGSFAYANPIDDVLRELDVRLLT